MKIGYATRYHQSVKRWIANVSILKKKKKFHAPAQNSRSFEILRVLSQRATHESTVPVVVVGSMVVVMPLCSKS